MQRYYIRSGFQLVQVVRPPLHHGIAFGLEFGAIIGVAQGVPDRVRKLRFDHGFRDAQALHQHGACGGPESVR